MAHLLDNIDTGHISFRSSSSIIPTDIVAVLEMDYADERGYVNRWASRIVFAPQGFPDDPVVEFYIYDSGYFVSSYYSSTLLGHTDGTGLWLEGSSKSCIICYEDLVDVLSWLEEASYEAKSRADEFAC